MPRSGTQSSFWINQVLNSDFHRVYPGKAAAALNSIEGALSIDAAAARSTRH
jgi:hypothetical protein